MCLDQAVLLPVALKKQTSTGLDQCPALPVLPHDLSLSFECFGKRASTYRAWTTERTFFASVDRGHGLPCSPIISRIILVIRRSGYCHLLAPVSATEVAGLPFSEHNSSILPSICPRYPLMSKPQYSEGVRLYSDTSHFPYNRLWSCRHLTTG